MQIGFSPKEGGTLEGFLEQVRYGEELGYDSAWVAEHHEYSEDYWPAPLVRLAALASRTETIRLGTSIYILPLHNPIDVAEQTAMVDQLSDGRVTMGFGMGYVDEEYAAYNVPLEEKVGRFVEGLALVDRFLSSDGPFSFEGRIYQLEDWQPSVEPVQAPRPPIWIGGYGEKSLERSMRFSDAWIPGSTPSVPDLVDFQESLRSYAVEFGKDWDALDHPMRRILVVGETHEEAVEYGREYVYESYAGLYSDDGWSHPVLSKDDLADFETLAEDRFLYGTPAEIVEQIEAMRERVDVTELILRLHFAGMPNDHLERQLELVADEVIPELP